MRTLRLRLLVPLGIGLTLLLGFGGFVLYGAVRSALVRAFDDTLLGRGRALIGHLEIRVAPEHRARVERLGAAAVGEPGDPTARQALLSLAREAFDVRLADVARIEPEYGEGEDGAYYQVWRHDGTVLARSASLGEEDLVWDAPLRAQPSTVDVVLPDGRPGRAGVWRPVEARFPDAARQAAWQAIEGAAPLPRIRELTVVVARPTASMDASLRTLERALLGFGVALVIGGGVIALLLVLRGLAPLEELRLRIEALDPAALDQRVTLRRPPAELEPVVSALNRQLDALEHAFERERRTTAHIAHELRTPIAELRSLTEVALQFPDDAELAHQSLTQAHEASVHMSRLVEAVMRLARARRPDDGTEAGRLEPAALVEEAWSGLRAAAEARRQVLDLDVAGDVGVHADREAVAALLANLLGNAVRHAPPGSTVRVAARREEGRVVVEVANPCDDLEPADLEHLVEPFWRKDAARADSELGGLGLALARAWAEAAGVELAFALRDGTFVAALGLPAAG